MGYKDLESTIQEAAKRLQANPEALGELGAKPEAVLEVLHNGVFVERKSFTVILIHNRSYIVYGYYYCSCRDFYMKNIVGHKNQPCKHMLALACFRATRSAQEPFSVLPSAETMPKATTTINTNSESAKPT